MTEIHFEPLVGKVAYVTPEQLHQLGQEWAERERRFRASPAYAAYQAKIRHLLARGLDSELEKLIKDDSPDALEQFTTIRLHQKADRKARYCSKRICDLTEIDYELSFGIATKRDDPALSIHNLEPYFDQGVLPSSCHDWSTGIQKTVRYIAPNDEELIGWAHSHGRHHRFLSPWDYSRIKNDLEEIGKRIRINKTEDDPEGDEVIIAPLLVYNATMGRKDKPYAAIAVGYTSYVTGQFKVIINENVKLKMIRGRSHLDTKALDDILMDRVWCLPPGVPGDGRYISEKRTGSGFSIGKSMREFVRGRAA